MKVCLFGGTFDPPHIGHLLIAQTVIESENFDKFIFVPANLTPNKVNKLFTDPLIRKEMLELAIKDNPNFDLSDYEIKKGDISFTVETIKFFATEMGLEKENLYFLMGSDTLQDFHNWEQPREIIKYCNILVATRPGFRPSNIPQWVLDSVHFANIPQFEISSSEIRRRWKENKTIRYMVTREVWEFINQNNLY